jgi:hypothetical protein
MLITSFWHILSQFFDRVLSSNDFRLILAIMINLSYAQSLVHCVTYS